MSRGGTILDRTDSHRASTAAVHGSAAFYHNVISYTLIQFLIRAQGVWVLPFCFTVGLPAEEP